MFWYLENGYLGNIDRKAPSVTVLDIGRDKACWIHIKPAQHHRYLYPGGLKKLGLVYDPAEKSITGSLSDYLRDTPN